MIGGVFGQAMWSGIAISRLVATTSFVVTHFKAALKTNHPLTDCIREIERRYWAYWWMCSTLEKIVGKLLE